MLTWSKSKLLQRLNLEGQQRIVHYSAILLIILEQLEKLIKRSKFSILLKTNLFQIKRVYAVAVSFEMQPSTHWVEHLLEAATEVFCKKAILKNFAIFTGKHLCYRLFLKQFQPRRPATILKETPTQVFFCEYCKIFKKTYF